MISTTLNVSREKLLQVARSVPVDLQVLSSLGEMLQDTNTSLEDVATLLRQDASMTGRILRIANSAMFGGCSIGSIEEAVNRVGFGEVIRLVGTATAARMSDQSLVHYGISSDQLRDTTLFFAFAAEAVARAAGADERAAYTAGLLRPLGMMVLDRIARANPGVPSFDATAWADYAGWERQIFGTENRAVAALILSEWRFPNESARAMQAHHLTSSRDYDLPLACILNVAGGAASRTGRSFPGENALWEITAEKLSALSITEHDVELAIEQATRATEAALAVC